MSEIYRKFAGEGDHLDFSREAAEDMYLFETRGIGDLKFQLFTDGKINGFAVGKRYMNVAIEMWKRDIPQGLIFRKELEEEFPKWFLDKFLGTVRQGHPLSSKELLKELRILINRLEKKDEHSRQN